MAFPFARWRASARWRWRLFAAAAGAFVKGATNGDFEARRLGQYVEQVQQRLEQVGYSVDGVDG